jgi:4-amino-4-deoxy-L-arabinose transferase-like glycosyltransferase
MARNLLAEPDLVWSVPRTPLGPPGDKPPLYPSILAGFVRLLGPTETAVRLPSLLMTLVTLVATAALVSRFVGAPWGLLTILILLTLPWFADTSRWVAGEIPATMFCALGMVLVTANPISWRKAVLAGGLFGLAFLCKLWFAVLLLAPALLYLLPTAPAARRTTLFLLAGAVGIGLLQLLGVLLFRSGELPHWLDIYFGFSLTTRLAGEGYADYWMKPPAYYAASITKAFVLLLPLVGLGFEYTLRRLREPMARLFLSWGLLVVVLSLFAVKSWIYLYPVIPAWAALAAVGAASLWRGTPRVGVVTGLLFLISLPPVATWGGLTPPPLGAWVGIWVLFGAALLLGSRTAGWYPKVAILLCALAVAGGAFRVAQRLPLPYHDPGYKETAQALEPYLRDVPPSQVSYLAPEAPSFAYYLFRTGTYWGSAGTPWTETRFLEVQSDPSYRAFIIDPVTRHEGGWPGDETVAWLESSTREITDEIESRAGRKISVRVFVREE